MPGTVFEQTHSMPVAGLYDVFLLGDVDGEGARDIGVAPDDPGGLLVVSGGGDDDPRRTLFRLYDAGNASATAASWMAHVEAWVVELAPLPYDLSLPLEQTPKKRCPSGSSRRPLGLVQPERS